MFRSAIAIAVITLAFSFEMSAQEKITIRLSLVEIDKDGERPAKGMLVLILPKNQGVAKGTTDSNGRIAFEFDQTESVTFRVGKISESIRLQPLSGRLSQTTSYVLDRRDRSYGKVAMAAAPSGTGPWGVLDLLSDVATQAGGRLMDDQTREYVKELRNEVLELTTPPSDADDETREIYRDDRSMLLEEIDSLLSAPWRMRAAYESHPDGAALTEISPDGPAANAGLQVGDIVTHVNSKSVVESQNSLQWMIANSVSSAIELEVISQNQVRRVSVNLTR